MRWLFEMIWLGCLIISAIGFIAIVIHSYLILNRIGKSIEQLVEVMKELESVAKIEIGKKFYKKGD